MEQLIKTEYRGFELIYQTTDDNWALGGDKGENKRTFEKLSDAKIYINEIMKGDFKRFNVIYRDRFTSEMKKMIVTSKIDNDHFWLADESKRMKVHIKSCFVDNDHNNLIMNQINKVSEDIERLVDIKEKLLLTMESIYNVKKVL